MRHETPFSVRYLTDDTVPIRDIIESLQGVESVLGEVSRLLPSLVDGLKVERIEVRVREIAQESPLREIYLVALFLAFQKDLEQEVTEQITALTGWQVPESMDTIVTVLALVIVFYGVGAIKSLVLGKADDGPSERQLNGLIEELSNVTGKTQRQIRQLLENRYRDRTLWKRLANATSRFFLPSKRQDSAPIEVNQRRIERETVRDVPADYLVEHEADVKPSRDFFDATLELHAQDRDHAGRGWAAIPRGINDQRLRLKLMPEVSAVELWGNDIVRGDITVLYERVGLEMVPREIHLHRVTGTG
ncbi:MAG: hypothetical protein H7X93_10475 [Sphingomonadaceae bacterium]|nr:hypothetical protein [Sphingomonadaceae bacterium]